MKKTLLIVLVTVLATGCRKEFASEDYVSRPVASYNGKMVRDYFTLLCRVSRQTPGFFPPQVARAYGYVGITAYEAVVNGIPGAQSLAGQLNGFNSQAVPRVQPALEYDWAVCSNAALAAIFKSMFAGAISPASTASIDSLEQVYYQRSSAGVKADVVDRSVLFGKAIATAVYHYSLSDGADKSYLDPYQLPFTIPVADHCWVPTGAVNNPIAPYWGQVRPFLTANVSGTQQFQPLTFGTTPNTAFYQQAYSVYRQVQQNTAEHAEIARYWADDPFNTCTPAGHTFNILTQLLEETGATLEKTSMAYARLSIAENDAFIACWKSKYTYNLIRPVTYIRKYIDAGFNTVIGTPPFPAYVSGHSAEIGAGSRVFTDLFTDGSGHYNFTDYSQLQYGFAARRFSSFQQMADECANSRLYGGIHFPMDNDDGLLQGKIVGNNVNQLINWPRNTR